MHTNEFWKRGDTHHGQEGLRSGSEGYYILYWQDGNKQKREKSTNRARPKLFKFLATWNVVSSLLEFECFPQAAEATSKEGQQKPDKARTKQGLLEVLSAVPDRPYPWAWYLYL